MFALNTTIPSLLLVLASVVLVLPTPAASLYVPHVTVSDLDCVNACAPIVSASAACTPSVVNQIDACKSCMTAVGMSNVAGLSKMMSKLQIPCPDVESTPSEPGAPEGRSSGTGRRVLPHDARRPTVGIRGAINLLLAG